VNVLSPYLNFHRPCLFPEEVVDAKGKRKKRYPYANLMTPYDKLKSLPDADQYLKAGVTFEQLDDIAMECSDNEAARHLNKARDILFREINRSRKPAACRLNYRHPSGSFLDWKVLGPASGFGGFSAAKTLHPGRGRDLGM
jgi:hypothetical protein